MENNNEVTIKINFSDSLLNKMTNMLLISNQPMSLGVTIPQVKQSDKTKKNPPIGFKN